MLIRFLIYGTAGWILEILWTAAGAIRRGDKRLMGFTSLWMFPIYGSAVFLEPLCDAIYFMPVFVRGLIYMLCIFAAEYISGYSLQKIVGVCPWDYSESRYNIYGLIRLDYAPCWYIVGLMFETAYRMLV